MHVCMKANKFWFDHTAIIIENICNLIIIILLVHFKNLTVDFTFHFYYNEIV